MQLTRSNLSRTTLGALVTVASLAGAAAADSADTAELSPANASWSTPLPSLSGLPNIQAAAASRFGSSAVVRERRVTISGFQIYRCDLVNNVPTWALRTPLAHFQQVAADTTTNIYHARSDFGGIVSDDELRALGLRTATGTVTAPFWRFAYGSADGTVRREIVAGQVVAQDSGGAGNIPALLVQVRGQAVTTITGGVPRGTTSVANPSANPVAASEYILRLDTRGGVAPAATSCTTATLGRASQQPYRSTYYFVDINPPAGI